MPVVGMMHDKKDPAQVNKAYACAAVAKAESIPFYYFSPGEVDIKKEIIRGFIYEDGRWVQKTLRYPDVVYNTGSGYEVEHYPAIEELENKLPFTTHAVGNKQRVYERLKRSKKYVENLPRTEVISSPSEPLQFLEQYNRVIIKPASGRQGTGVVFAEKTSRGIRVTEAMQSRILSLEQFRRYIEEKVKIQRHLVQPYIKSITRYGLAYDIRLHVQKNGLGEWVFVAGFVRVAPPGTVVCNISQGGYFNYLKTFLIHEYGERSDGLRSKLKKFALGLARHLDEIHAEKFDTRLDELGIDVGIDENEHIWLYEVNWRPGSPPLLYLELDVVKNALEYAVYLARLKR
ncbi:MAG: YheC/YheD family protein [Bacillota bacterium]